MRIIIIGCGRMGAGLTQLLEQQQHTVTVVDRDPTAFERLGSSFRGQTVVGIGFDREALLAAGIEHADGLAAVTASDDVNVVAARLARQVFRVPRVVARVYDPRKADVYRRLGLPTISTTQWGIQRMGEVLGYSNLAPLLSLGQGEVDIIETEVPALLVGRTVNDLTFPGEAHVIAVSREGKTFLPSLGTIFRPGDLAHLAVTTTYAERLKTMLA